MEQLLSPEDVAQRLQCSLQTARQIMRFKLAHVRVGRLLRVREDILLKWIERGGVNYDFRPRAVSPEQEIAPPREPRMRSPKSDGISARIAASALRSASKITINPRRGHGQNSQVLVTGPDGKKTWARPARSRPTEPTPPVPCTSVASVEPGEFFTVRTPLEAKRAGEARARRRKRTGR